MNRHPKVIWLDKGAGSTWARRSGDVEPSDVNLDPRTLEYEELSPEPYRQSQAEAPRGDVIYLAPDCGEGACGDERLWCEDNVWGTCVADPPEPGCRAKSIRYVRQAVEDVKHGR